MKDSDGQAEEPKSRKDMKGDDAQSEEASQPKSRKGMKDGQK